MLFVAESTKPLGQLYHEQVEALKAEGMSNADAVRAVAAKQGKQQNAVRAGIHQYKSRHDGGGGATPRRNRRSSVATIEDHLAAARKSLESALGLLDREVGEAKTALDAAQARYDQAVASANNKRADLEQKLRALS